MKREGGGKGNWEGADGSQLYRWICRLGTCGLQNPRVLNLQGESHLDSLKATGAGFLLPLEAYLRHVEPTCAYTGLRIPVLSTHTHTKSCFLFYSKTSPKIGILRPTEAGFALPLQAQITLQTQLEHNSS